MLFNSSFMNKGIIPPSPPQHGVPLLGSLLLSTLLSNCLRLNHIPRGPYSNWSTTIGQILKGHIHFRAPQGIYSGLHYNYITSQPFLSQSIYFPFSSTSWSQERLLINSPLSNLSESLLLGELTCERLTS